MTLTPQNTPAHAHRTDVFLWKGYMESSPGSVVINSNHISTSDPMVYHFSASGGMSEYAGIVDGEQHSSGPFVHRTTTAITTQPFTNTPSYQNLHCFRRTA